MRQLRGDLAGVYNYAKNPNSPNAVHPAKAGLNTAVGVYGLYVNPYAATLYFGIDAFYPGGWPAAMQDQDRLYNENRAINPNFQLWPMSMKQ